MTENNFELPPRVPQGAEGAEIKDGERLYRTALSSRDYLRLEIESMERGLKPFGLTKAVMTLYLNKRLVNVRELPVEIQSLIHEHFKKNAKPRTI